MNGKFVVIEGMDGSGTTTQVAKLCEYLVSRGLKVSMSAEPTRSALGVEIRRMLASPIEEEPNLLLSLALCFAADRMQHVNSIVSELKENDVVLLDRYVLSSLVYQGLHVPLAFVREINRFAIKPDLCIVLDIDARSAFDRLLKRKSTKDFYESYEMLNKIRVRYQQLAESEPDTVVIDAHGSEQEVHGLVLSCLRRLNAEF